jgi:hypothetical protein
VPFIAKVSAADAEGDSAPTSFVWTYSNSEDKNSGSAKAIRVDSNDNVYGVMGMGDHSTIFKLDDAGEEVWLTESMKP